LAKGRVEHTLDRDHCARWRALYIYGTGSDTQSHIDGERYVRTINHSVAVKVASICLSPDGKWKGEETGRQRRGTPVKKQQTQWWASKMRNYFHEGSSGFAGMHFRHEKLYPGNKKRLVLELDHRATLQDG
jgi:hypothetical protein